MPKDRAAPFSRKHRRYWIPVTGGMLLIGGLNLTIGVCSYSNPPPTTPMKLHLPPPDHTDDGPTRPPGAIGPGDLPVPVIRAFAIKYPKTISLGAFKRGDTYVVLFPPGAPHKTATFKSDGTFVSDD